MLTLVLVWQCLHPRSAARVWDIFLSGESKMVHEEGTVSESLRFTPSATE